MRRRVRALTAIALLVVLLASLALGEHVHARKGDGPDSSGCVVCQLQTDPSYLDASPGIPERCEVEQRTSPPPGAAPRATACLAYAPKQGPPAA